MTHAWFLGALLVLIGCGGDDGGGDRDAGRDGGGEADAGPAIDAGPESDAGGDAGGTVDAGADDAGGDDAGPTDGGALDGGPPDAGPPDAGPSCAGVDCSSFDTACLVGTCDPATGACLALPRPDGTVCGASSGECDAPDTCEAGTCRTQFAGAGASCGSSAGTECTRPDTCDGAGNCLPNHFPVTSPCGFRTGECDDVDVCDGAGTCEPRFAAAGAPCGDRVARACSAADTCDGSGACLINDLPAGTGCGDSATTACTAPDTCDGTGTCLANHRAAGTACGDATDGPCTNPDGCDGSGTCLVNHEPDGTSCGSPPATDCDDPDRCTAGSCVDVRAPAGTPCTDCPGGPPCLTCTAGGMCSDAPACTYSFTDVTAARGLPVAAGSLALVWGDFDADGDPDLFVRQHGLYMNGAGTFTEESAARGVSDLGAGLAGPVSVGDFDGDGRLDLFVGNDTRSGALHNRMYRNTGGSFTNVAAAFGLELMMNTPQVGLFFDHDRDRDLDFLYANEFNSWRMFRNDRALPFGDDNARFSTFLQGDSAQFADYDDDGDYDLFLATGSGGVPNRLFRFDGTSWVDVAVAAGVDGGAFSFRWGGATWVDFDADGDLDLHVPADGDTDTVYSNDGDGTFTAIAASSRGLPDIGFINAAMWADYDLDGDLDAYFGGAGVYRNDAGTFVRVAGAAPSGQVGAWADFDGDGHLDLATTTFGATRLYRSTRTAPVCRDTMGSVRLRVLTDLNGDATDATTSDDFDALGARVVVDLDGDGDFVSGGYTGPDRTVTYLVGMGQSAKNAQSDLSLLIGIGAAASVDIRVRFVDGSTVTLGDVARGVTTTARDAP